MTDTPDSSTAAFSTSGEKPLGIYRPLLSPTALGQSMLQSKFMTPLGANSLTVLDPSVFSSQVEANPEDWQTPFEDSPFFDPPQRSRTPSPAPPGSQPTVQARSLETNTTNTTNSPTSSLQVQESPWAEQVQLFSESPAELEALSFNSNDSASEFPIAQPSLESPLSTTFPKETLSSERANQPINQSIADASVVASPISRAVEDSQISQFAEEPEE
ncbi:MAG: hypothetical protein SFW36_15970, partial [Leptolyngbyaceae cyanobacterium bins.59]|nr:hypothetical protein [Leptolyngbyaceae cyanobacterium bins.59]